MTLRNAGCKKTKQSMVTMAVAAVVGESRVDTEMAVVDHSPFCLGLDLPDEEMRETCSHPHCSSPAEDACAECGSPRCGDCN